MKGTFGYGVRKAIQVAAQGWSMVTSHTICRGFKRAGFRNPAVTETTPEEEENLTSAARANCVFIPWDTDDADIILTEVEVFQTHAIYEDEIANEFLAPVGEEGVSDASESIPINPSHQEFLATLESRKMVRLNASFEYGPEMDELHTLSFRMQSNGIRHVLKKKQTTSHQLFAPRE